MSRKIVFSAALFLLGLSACVWMWQRSHQEKEIVQAAPLPEKSVPAVLGKPAEEIQKAAEPVVTIVKIPSKKHIQETSEALVTTCARVDFQPQKKDAWSKGHFLLPQMSAAVQKQECLKINGRAVSLKWNNDKTEVLYDKKLNTTQDQVSLYVCEGKGCKLECQVEESGETNTRVSASKDDSPEEAQLNRELASLRDMIKSKKTTEQSVSWNGVLYEHQNCQQ